MAHACHPSYEVETGGFLKSGEIANLLYVAKFQATGKPCLKKWKVLRTDTLVIFTHATHTCAPTYTKAHTCTHT